MNFKHFASLSIALAVCVSAAAQSAIQRTLERFTDPDKGKVVFIEKGNRAFGIRGSYRDFTAGGDGIGDGFAILSLLNLGKGQLRVWNVAPSFSFFPADDFSLGVRLDYNGYLVDSDLKLDFRDALAGIFPPDPNDPQSNADLNITISNRHMIHHAGGVSFTARKYLSFFGSKMLGVFGEARLFTKYGTTLSHPIQSEDDWSYTEKKRVSRALGVGLNCSVGAAIKLKDGSAITASLPILGVAWNKTWQNRTGANGTTNDGSVSSFKIARNVEFLGLQIGYVHYIKPKKQN